MLPQRQVECGAQETVAHVLDCPRLRLLRQDLRRKVADALNSVSRLLRANEEGKGVLADCLEGRAAIVGSAVLITTDIA